MYKHTKFFVKRQAESGIFYPICIIWSSNPAPQATFPPEMHHAGQSRQPGALPHRPHRPAPVGPTLPSDPTAFPSLTSGPPLSQRAPLFFRPSVFPSHNDRAISHPDERLLSLTNIPPGAANTRDKRAAAKQKAGAEKCRGGKRRDRKRRDRKCRDRKCRGGKASGRKLPGRKLPEWKVPERKVPERGKGIKRRRPYRDAAFHIP